MEKGKLFYDEVVNNNWPATSSVLINGALIVTWQNWNQTSAGRDVYIQNFVKAIYNDTAINWLNEYENVVDSYKKTSLNTWKNYDQSDAKLEVLTSSNIVATWQSWEQDSSDYGIYAQVFNSNGLKIGDEFRVNTNIKYNQHNPAVASLYDGGFIIAWQSWEQDGSDEGIYAQVFSNNGTKIGNELQVNTYIKYNQHNPTVASLPDGGFVIAWQSFEQDGSDEGIYAQVFDSSSTKIGNEFQVNTYIKYNQHNPAVASLSDGGFIIAWQSWEQDGSDEGIYAQVFSNNGTKIGNELQVNTYIKYNQHNPTVASLPDGGFVIAWQSFEQDGIDNGVYAQFYNSDRVKIGKEKKVSDQNDFNQLNPNIINSLNGNIIITCSNQQRNKESINYYGLCAKEYTNIGEVVASNCQNNITYIHEPLFVPSLPPTATPSISSSFNPTYFPTITPSSVIPTGEPSGIPTAFPTRETSDIPSSEPTFETLDKPTPMPSSVIPTGEPSGIPTAFSVEIPTYMPSVASPITQQPTIAIYTAAPSMFPSLPYITVEVSEGIHIGSPKQENFVINVTTNTIITGGGGGDLYCLKPSSNIMVTITDFDQNSDMVDFSAFQYINSINDLNITYGSVLIHLEGEQKLRLLNLSISDVSNDNFIFFSAPNQPTIAPTSSIQPSYYQAITDTDDDSLLFDFGLEEILAIAAGGVAALSIYCIIARINHFWPFSSPSVLPVTDEPSQPVVVGANKVLPEEY
jgi:predicted SnoaL-like aldol condensation-catalyzing enzyme